MCHFSTTEGASQVADEETTAHLVRPEQGNNTGASEEASVSPGHVLPIALLAALAMVSTSATAYFAYGTLICRDPTDCKGNETNNYSGLVAIVTCTSNILGMLALGWLQN